MRSTFQSLQPSRLGITSTALRKLADFHPTRRMIVALIAEGLAVVEIAERIDLSVDTVKWHEKAIFRALGVAKRSEVLPFLIGQTQMRKLRKAIDDLSRTDEPRPFNAIYGRRRALRQKAPSLRARLREI